MCVIINRTRENYEELKKRFYPKKGSFAWLFLHYMKLLHPNTENVLKSNFTRMTPELIAEIKQMDEFSNQARFLARYNINTSQELLEFEKLTYEKVNPLKSKRENLWKKRKRAKTDEEKQAIENEIVEISKQITPIVEEIKHCNNIMKRMEKIKQYQEHQQLEKVLFEKEQNKKLKSKVR